MIIPYGARLCPRYGQVLIARLVHTVLRPSDVNGYVVAPRSHRIDLADGFRAEDLGHKRVDATHCAIDHVISRQVTVGHEAKPMNRAGGHHPVLKDEAPGRRHGLRDRG